VNRPIRYEVAVAGGWCFCPTEEDAVERGAMRDSMGYMRIRYADGTLSSKISVHIDEDYDEEQAA
jgi:hypothetical protein